jgi:hypothetical protein
MMVPQIDHKNMMSPRFQLRHKMTADGAESARHENIERRVPSPSGRGPTDSHIVRGARVTGSD